MNIVSVWNCSGDIVDKKEGIDTSGHLSLLVFPVHTLFVSPATHYGACLYSVLSPGLSYSYDRIPSIRCEEQLILTHGFESFRSWIFGRLLSCT